MTRTWRPVLIFTTTAGVLAVGGSIAALASWSTAPTAAKTTITAGQVPTMQAPRVFLVGRPVVRWDRVRMSPGTPVQRYVVTRHDGDKSSTVCEVPALIATCVDLLAPLSRPVSYSVHATFRKWVGTDGARSGTLTVPRGLAAPSAAAVAKVTAAATVTPQALAATDPTTPTTDQPTPPTPADDTQGGETPAGTTPPATQPGTAQPETPEPVDPPTTRPAVPEATQPTTAATGPATGPTAESAVPNGSKK